MISSMTLISRGTYIHFIYGAADIRGDWMEKVKTIDFMPVFK